MTETTVPLTVPTKVTQRGVRLARLRRLAAENGTFLALLGLVVVFGIWNPRFLTMRNIDAVVQQVAELSVLSVPIALLLIAGYIDLSVGSVASLCGYVGAVVMVNTSVTVLGILAALAVGIAAGAINGILITHFRLNPIVVTLGFLTVYQGLTRYLSNGQTQTGLPDSFDDLGNRRLLGLPIQVLVAIAVAAAGWWLLNRHYLGRYIYAVGDNQRAAGLMGVNVSRVHFGLYVLCGLGAATTGMLLAAKLGAVPVTLGANLELRSLTVVLLGGVAFAGGSGRISGVIAGLLFVGALQNGLIIVGVSEYVQQIILGATLILAVALDDTLRRQLRRSWTIEAVAEDTGAAGPSIDQSLPKDRQPPDAPSPIPASLDGAPTTTKELR